MARVPLTSCRVRVYFKVFRLAEEWLLTAYKKEECNDRHGSGDNQQRR